MSHQHEAGQGRGQALLLQLPQGLVALLIRDVVDVARALDLVGERWALLVNPEKFALADVFRLFAFTPAPESGLSDRVAQVVNRDLSTTIAAYFSAPDANANSWSST